MDELKTNTHKKHYHIAITLDGKLIDTFGAHTDSVLNALKSAYEQCCGYQGKPREPLPEPQETVLPTLPPLPSENIPKKRGRKPKNA